MQTIHDLLMSMTAMLFAVAGMVALYEIWRELEYRRSLARGVATESPSRSGWKVSLGLAMVAWIPLLVALALVLWTNGRVGVRIEQGDDATAVVESYTAPQSAAKQPSRMTAVAVRH